MRLPRELLWVVDGIGGKNTALAGQHTGALQETSQPGRESTQRWEAPHRLATDGNDVCMESGIIKYDGALVGRRCTAFWSPPEGEAGTEGYYAATIVAYNSLTIHAQFRTADVGSYTLTMASVNA